MSAPFDVQRTNDETTTRDPRLARHQQRAGARRGDRQDRRDQAAPKVVVDLSGARPDRQLGRRRARQALQGRARQRRCDHDRGRARPAARDLQAAADGQGVQPLGSRAARPRDHQDLPQRRRAAVGAVQPPAVRRARQALRARGDGDDPVVSGRRAWSSRWSSAGKLAAVPRRETDRRHRRSATRARCSCRGSRTARGVRCTRRRSRRRCARYRGKVDVVLGSWAYPDGFAAVIAGAAARRAVRGQAARLGHQRDREAARAAAADRVGAAAAPRAWSRSAARSPTRWSRSACRATGSRS